jgi:hypothetical protein
MTDEQIEAALAVCKGRAPGRAVTGNTAMGKYERLLMFSDRPLQMPACDAEYFATTTDPDTGYEAALLELREARAQLQEAVRLLHHMPYEPNPGLDDCECPGCTWMRGKNAFLFVNKGLLTEEPK